MTTEVEEGRKILQLIGLMPGVGQLRVGVTELVKERVNHGVDGAKPLRWGVLEQSGDEVNRIGIRLSEHLVEGMGLDLGELVLHIVGVHRTNLLPCRCAQHLDDLNQLVYALFAGEEWLSKHELCHHTSR